ncbi:MAG: hypothetical protein PHN54_02105 [Bacilli bacterium]|nr:hypothetical protein [Bacilli bacterium]
MIELNKKQLVNVVGGVNYTIIGLFVCLASFVLAFLDGFIRPLSCKR